MPRRVPTQSYKSPLFSDINNPNGSGYFQVQPTLTLGAEDEPLPLDCIQCQTIISKLLGPFPEWEGRLRVSKESGYNMVHLTPTQELGISNSAYSLADQLVLSPAYSTPDAKYSYDHLKQLIQKMKNEWKVSKLAFKLGGKFEISLFSRC